MIKVACPSCSAPYDLDERRLPASGLRMRCPKCASSFQVNKDGSVDASAAAPKPARKKTMVGVGGAPPPPKKPIAPAFPAGVGGGSSASTKPETGTSKLPAGVMGGSKPAPPAKPPSPFKPKPPAPPAPDAIDLPALKKPGAPAGLDLDDGIGLPAPVRSAAKAPARPAPPKPAVPRPAPPKPPAAQPTPSGGVDLPAPSRRRPDGGVDLPAPAGRAKRPIAPPTDDGLDLPTPARKIAPPVAPGAGRKIAPPIDDGLDLPRPGRKIAPPIDDGLDLPVPSGARSGPGSGVDLPTPARRAPQDDGLDLPRPAGRRPLAPTLDELDLPTAVGRPSDPGGLDLDLPQVKGSRDGLDLDLPAPKSSRDSLDLDFPTPKRPGSSDLELDLPTPAGGAGGLDLDLPTPAADLPRPVARTPFDDFDSELPAPAASLPTPAGGGSSGFGELDLDLPTPAADLPTPAADLPVPAADLPTPSAELPTPSAQLPRPAASSGDLPGIGDLPGFDAPGFEDDDLALPDPRPIGAVTADGRAGAGGASFGEIELGDEPSGDSLEFDEIPEEEDDEPSDVDLPAADAAPAAKKKKRARPVDDAAPKKKKRTGLWVMVALVLLIVGGGAALHFTPYGLFGMYFVEQYRPEAGDPGAIQLVLDDADALAASDTNTDYRAALRTLADARREFYYNRKLLARSVVYEALYQVRFGEELRSQSREGRILDRLAIRGNEAPGMDLALAAHELREGNLGAVPRHLTPARRQNPNDLLVHIVAGELALQQGDADAALEAFQSIDLETDARSSWGTARAHREKGDAEAFAAAVATTLERSPRHAAALVATADLAMAAENVEEAMAAAEAVVGRVEIDGARVRASDEERAAAWTLLGRLHEAAGRRGAAQEAYAAAVDAEPFQLFALLGLGRLSLDEGRYSDARTQFEAAEQSLQERPLPPAEAARSPELDIRLGKIRALIALDQAQQAASEAEALVGAFPEEPRAWLWRGKALEGLEDTSGALEAYRQSVTLAPETFDGYLAQAQLHFASDAPTAAGEVLAAARERVPPSVEMHRAMGESELRRGNLERAKGELESALALRDDDPESLFLSGQVLRRMRQLDASAARLDALAAIDPGYPGLALERGRLYEARGNPEQAVRAYTTALEERPDDLDLLLRLGGAQVAAGQLEEAEEVLGRVMEERANSAEAEFYLGRIALARDETQRALAHLGRAVELDGGNAEFRLYLGTAYLETNNLARALEEVRRAIDLDDSIGRAYLVRGQVLLRSGSVAEARSDFDRALELQPNLIEARAALADAYQQLGRGRDAIAAMERALEADAERGPWWYQLGRMRLDIGRTREAGAAFERALQRAESEAIGSPAPEWVYESHRHLGEAELRAGRRAQAMQHFRLYLEKAPDTAIDRAEVQRQVDRGS